METAQFDLYVGNLDCEHDAAALERGLDGTVGLVGLKIYPKAAKVSLTYNPAIISEEALRENLNKIGFPPQTSRTAPQQPKVWENPKVITSVISGILLLVGWLLGSIGLGEPFTFGIYILAMLIGGYYFGREALEELIFEQKVGIELLMSIAAVAAALLGEPAEGAMLVFLYSLSEAAEGYTEEKTRSAIRALMDLTPKMVIVKRHLSEVKIPVEELNINEVFIVKPGESNVNQAPVTGESVPVEKQIGDTVYAGTINGEGALEIQATKTFADNTIARIIHMVEEAQEKKGQSQKFIERFGAKYSPSVLLLGILIGVLPPLLFNGAWETWLTRAVVFIVAAAPCALVISVPITMVATLGTGARKGVLVKGGTYIEQLARVNVVAMDKTGTLTRGEPEVTDVVPLGQYAQAPQEMLAQVAGLESRSQHPLARAITTYAQAQAISPVEVAGFRSLTGSGASAQFSNTIFYVGSPDLFEKQLGIRLESVQSDIEYLQSEGKTVVLAGNETGLWGLIAIRDNIRSNTIQAIKALHEAGIKKVVMLTGDNERTAQAIAREIGLDEVYADLKPEDKVAQVRDIAQRDGHVAMVGDGVNDAPALAEATVGVAMGAAGTDVALETADIALMADDLERLAYAIQLAKRSQNVVKQNLILSMLVISVLVVGAIVGAFSLPVAVLAHEISEFIVIGSGLRMLRA